MTMSSSLLTRAVALAGVLAVARSAGAQTRLSMGDAARLAAKQNGVVDVARARVAQAEASRGAHA
jgi:outer membrane protein